MEYEAVLFLLSVVMGAALFLFYKILTALRKVISHPSWAVDVEDLFLLDCSRDFYVFCDIQVQSGNPQMFSFCRKYSGSCSVPGDGGRSV